MAPVRSRQMARISSAAYVTAVLQFLQAYNRGNFDACERCLDPDVEWHSAVTYKGRAEVVAMLKSVAERWTRSQARPDDFRASESHVLMIICFNEGDPDAPQREERQSWIVDVNSAGVIQRVTAYPSPAEAARALDALALKVHA
jgi:ketosteroid isomerase-like protein